MLNINACHTWSSHNNQLVKNVLIRFKQKMVIVMFTILIPIMVFFVHIQRLFNCWSPPPPPCTNSQPQQLRQTSQPLSDIEQSHTKTKKKGFSSSIPWGISIIRVTHSCQILVDRNESPWGSPPDALGTQHAQLTCSQMTADFTMHKSHL